MIVSTPGRICLFGEHQDYLGLPVIAAAISKRIQVKGQFRADNVVHFSLPDVERTEEFAIDFPLPYSKERDYFKSVLNVLHRKGHELTRGFEIEVRGNIPINSGTSSSSALLVSWVKFLVYSKIFLQISYTHSFDGVSCNDRDQISFLLFFHC